MPGTHGGVQHHLHPYPVQGTSCKLNTRYKGMEQHWRRSNGAAHLLPDALGSVSASGGTTRATGGGGGGMTRPAGAGATAFFGSAGAFCCTQTRRSDAVFMDCPVTAFSLTWSGGLLLRVFASKCPLSHRLDHVEIHMVAVWRRHCKKVKLPSYRL